MGKVERKRLCSQDGFDRRQRRGLRENEVISKKNGVDIERDEGRRGQTALYESGTKDSSPR